MTTTFRWQIWPTHFKKIFQPYGADGSQFGIDYAMFGQDHHCGVDIKSGLYGEIMAVAPGIVTAVQFLDWGLGLNITIMHGERFGTVYGHLSRNFVKYGEEVAAGEVIGWSGWTGNTKGDLQHVHVGQIDWHNGAKGCYGKYTDPEPYYRHLLGGEPQPSAPQPQPDDAEPAAFDLMSYIAGDGRSYYLRSPLGQEACRTEYENQSAYQVKNSQWEQLWAGSEHIYRGIDTSPGGGRYYRHYNTDGRPGAPWVKRHMCPGESFSSNKYVKWFHKADGRQHGEPQAVTDTITFVKHHRRWASCHQFVVDDVIELLWEEGGERYFYGRGFGLVGWHSGDGRIQSGIHSLTDERHERESIAMPHDATEIVHH